MSRDLNLCRTSPPARRQRGVVLLVILLVTMAFGGYFGVRALNAAVARSGIHEMESEKILSQARQALLAWSVTTDDSLPSATVSGLFGIRAFRPGNLPYPDLATGLTSTTPSDGVRDIGCARTTWAGSGTLRPITATLTNAQKTGIRCFGRLPVATLGLDAVAGSSADVSGRWPWYIVSANLVNINQDCPARLDGTLTNTALATGTNACGNINTPTAPFQWITVLDEYGAVISTRVAAVVILPGQVTTRQPGNVRQTRSATALPSAFLDTVDNAACVGGRCDNGRLNATPLTFIQCVKPASTAGDARFSANYACTDRLTYITVDELFAYAAKRIEREFTACLAEYAQNNANKYPWAALAGSPSSVTVGNTSGSFPSNDASANPTCANQQVYWGGWQRAATYTVAPDQSAAQFSFASLAGRPAVSVP